MSEQGDDNNDNKAAPQVQDEVASKDGGVDAETGGKIIDQTQQLEPPEEKNGTVEEVSAPTTDNNVSSTSSDPAPLLPPPSTSTSVCSVCNSVHPQNQCPLLNMDESQQAKFFKPTACIVCQGFHQQNRCPLLKMDETQQASFFQNMSGNHPSSSSSSSMGQSATAGDQTKEATVLPDDAVDVEHAPEQNLSTVTDEDKLDLSESLVDMVDSDSPSESNQACNDGVEQSEVFLDQGNVSDEKKRIMITDPVSTFVDVALTTGTEDQRSMVLPAPQRDGLDRESSRTSDSSTLQFVSPSTECARDDSMNTRHERAYCDSVGSSTIVVSNTDSSNKPHVKPVESIHTLFSPSDISYSLDVISKLKQSVYLDDDDDSIEDPKIKKGHGHGKANLPPRAPPIFFLWTYLTEELLHAGIIRFIVAISKSASRNPWKYIAAVVTLSFALVGVGFFTNFVMIFDHEVIFTPMGSLPTMHGEWVYEKAGFEDTADFAITVHSDGNNIMHVDAMRRTFEALDTLRSTPGYDELCAGAAYLNLKGEPDCWVWSTTQFWNHDIDLFEAEITTDEELIHAISQPTFTDGTPVYKEASYGKYTAVPSWQLDKKGKNVTFDLLTYVPNFILSVGLPDTIESEDFQWYALERLKELKTKWELEDMETNPHSVKLEFFTMYAYLLEYERALANDMPLVPLTFYVMLLFTCLVFHKLGMSTGKSPTGVEPSRFSLGVLSTLTIGMSLMTGYGFMFCVGIPFTNLSQMVPFIILGVGLDDTFIITGAYFRKLAEEHRYESNDDRDENEIITERIGEVMEEVGLSIALTTTTTTFAFCLGCLSTIPGIRWVCLYASVTIFADFLYQITLFVAFLTIDERRMNRARKKAKLQSGPLYLGNIYCQMRSTLEKKDTKKSKTRSKKRMAKEAEEEPIFTVRVMRCYANQLLRPRVKKAVLVVFSALFGLCVWRTTLLTQVFNVEDYVPEDSYTKTFFSSVGNYTSIKLPLPIYFRNVNQSDPFVQDEMREYIAALSELPQIQQPPDFCWVRDLHAYMTGEATDEMNEEQARQAKIIANAVRAGNNTFAEQLDILLNIPVIRDVYGGDIVRDEDGNILTSRCFLGVRHVDLKNVKEQTQLLYDQRQVTALFQPRIEDHVDPSKRGEFSFFTFDEMFYYWELYTVAVDELVFTTISGVVAVNIIGFLLIPHFSAVLFIFPIIIMLYFNLLGTLQMCGIFINAVTYVTIVIAIGLLVDFLMHILLRYYESTGTTRDEKVRETLETMGASMLMGGFTTWLGVIPLSLSSTNTFNTIFIAFMAMVSWGLLISLILMPVLLSYCGPLVCTIAPRATREQQLAAGKSQAVAKLIGGTSLQYHDKCLADDDDDDDSSLDGDATPSF